MRMLRSAMWLAVAACSTTSAPDRTGSVSNVTAAKPVLPPPSDVSGYASLPPQPINVTAIEGEVTLLDTGGQTEDTMHWRVEITSATKQRGVYLIDVPAKVNMPFGKGERLKLEAAVVGGGPNAQGTMAIVDDKGALRLAIHRLPTGWKADYGTPGAIDKDTSYDEQAFGVRIQHGADVVELDETWRIVTIGGARFHGKGSAAKRTLKQRVRPPDYVGQWIDFALVSVEDAP